MIMTEVSNEEGHSWTIRIRRENPKHENNLGMFLEILAGKYIIYDLCLMRIVNNIPFITFFFYWLNVIVGYSFWKQVPY
jgi:Na+-translocating ferredoxin:NAD+ oxidoreductase RnfA subunit